jgi:hypothetical protein
MVKALLGDLAGRACSCSQPLESCGSSFARTDSIFSTKDENDVGPFGLDAYRAECQKTCAASTTSRANC